MKILITGGHLAPLLAVLEELPKEAQVLLVGRKHAFEGDKSLSLEFQITRKLKIPFQEITTGRLQRTFTKYTIQSLLKFPWGFWQAWGIIKKYQPDVILSFGGYISLPVVLAGAILRIPIVVHEQTLSAGLANKIASLWAHKICISWEESKKYFPTAKTVLIGNPVRSFKIDKLPFKISDEALPLLYITGGSTGSHALNNLVAKNLEKLVTKFRIIHQIGGSWDFKSRKRYLSIKFINPSDVGIIISRADLIISRAGINTISELLFFKKPALLLPLNKEQIENALFFKKLGLGEILAGGNISSKDFYNAIILMMENYNKYKINKNVTELIRSDASKNLVAIIYEVCKQKY